MKLGGDPKGVGSTGKLTPAQKRAVEAAKAHSAAPPPQARRGEDDGKAPSPASQRPPSTDETGPKVHVELGRELAEPLSFTPAPEGAASDEVLAHYERLIARANSVVGGRLTTANKLWILVGGAALLALHEDGSWKSSGYTDWNIYTKKRWGVSGKTARNWMDAVQVYRELGDSLDRPLGARQVAMLRRIRKASGVAGMRENWEQSKLKGDVTPRGLSLMADHLVLAPGRDMDEGPERKPSSPSRGIVRIERATKALTLDDWKAAVAEDPQKARQALDGVLAVITEARQMLDAEV